MQTILILLGVWILINVLFVLIMIAPRRPPLAPVRIEQNGYPHEEQVKLLPRQVVISIAMGAFFPLTPSLIEALKRFIRKRRE